MVNKTLKHKDVLIRAENQDLPENPIEITDEVSRLKHYWFNEGLGAMLTPKDGYVWRKVKEE